MISERNTLQEEASKSGDVVLAEEFKTKAKEIKKIVNHEKDMGMMKDLGEKDNVHVAWAAARRILGIKKNLSPTALQDEQGDLTTNPTKMATLLNSYFTRKVKKLREKTNSPPTIDPVKRLQQWLDRRPEPPPPFKIKKITRTKLRTLIKKMRMPCSI